jgi:gliding motility-associated-like protein
MPVNNTLLYRALPFLLLFTAGRCFSQCSPQSGPPPAASQFNTGNDNARAILPAGAGDVHWQVVFDSINGAYQPAVVMYPVPGSYYPGHGAAWVSVNEAGAHTGLNRFIFYKTTFNLPCTNACGKPFTGINTFQLDLDLYADNSIYEIYINGVPQSGNLGNIIPVNNPYQADGASATGKISVSLTNNWVKGSNTLVIETASSPPQTGLLVQAYVKPVPPLTDTVKAVICAGQSYVFGGQNLTQPGSYMQTFNPAAYCDSIVTLQLQVTPKADTLRASVCQGQSYLGYMATGVYVDTITTTEGCKVKRTLNLEVTSLPAPKLPASEKLCTGDSVILSPGIFNSYLWQDGSANSQYTVKQPGIYAVTVTNACASASAQVIVTPADICNVFFPSAFTPNQDGANDYFKILTDLHFDQFSLLVYNRFGQKIFETNDPAKGWNGNYNGHTQPQGAYIWVCSYRKSGTAVQKQGTVILVR